MYLYVILHREATLPPYVCTVYGQQAVTKAIFTMVTLVFVFDCSNKRIQKDKFITENMVLGWESLFTSKLNGKAIVLFFISHQMY